VHGCRSVCALHVAVRNGHVDVVRLLVDAGADVEAQMTTASVSGLTPLHLAVQSGQMDVIDLLLAAGSNVNSGTLAANQSTC